MQDHAGSLGEELLKDRHWNVARTCVSFQPSDDSKMLQRIAFDHWHEILLSKITATSNIDAPRILCNCITQNHETSQRLLESVPAIPKGSHSNNWVDFILTNRSNRDCLAAVVACWYNATSVLQATTAHPLFLETLLRNAMSATTKVQDDATDWIRRAVCLYCRTVGLPESYESLGRTIVPEHVVFLLLLLRSIEEPPKSLHLLGDTPATIQANLKFLMQLVMREETTLDTVECSLHRDVRHLAMELINEALLESDNDGDRAYQVRRHIGEIPGLWNYLLTQLTNIVDHWNEIASVKKARDAPSLSDHDQRFLVNCVRCIGNLTYQCGYNQDCLRNVRLNKDRNGLHILLSTTGMAVSCFSLREWGIVAIRNALDQNLENQAIVERLQAEQAVQTTALDDMGIQIKITSDGKASISPKSRTGEQD